MNAYWTYIRGEKVHLPFSLSLFFLCSLGAVRHRIPRFGSSGIVFVRRERGLGYRRLGSIAVVSGRATACPSLRGLIFASASRSRVQLR